jgi:ATP/maltotriose-dependent transcriptional regulator MalT
MEIQFVLWTEFATLDRWIEALEDLLAKPVAFPDAETEVRVLSNLVQALTFRAPWQPQLTSYATRLLELAQADVAPNQRILAASALGHHFAWLGSMQQSLQAYSIARPLLARKEILPVHRVWVSLSLAYVAYTRADQEESDALFAHAFAITEEHGLSHVEFWMHAANCWHRLDRGEYKTVASILGKIEARLAAGRGMDVAHFHLVKGWLALLEGKFVLARREVETANALAGEAGANYTESYHGLMLAEVLIELGEFAQAQDWVARFRAMFGRVGSSAFEFNALLVDAYAALGKRDDARCAAALRAAFLIGRTNGYVQTLNWYARMMSRLCAFALGHDIEARVPARRVPLRLPGQGERRRPYSGNEVTAVERQPLLLR